MKTPEGWRRIEKGEIAVGDYIEYEGCPMFVVPNHWVEMRHRVESTDAGFGWTSTSKWQALRKETSPWISVGDRLPSASSWCFVRFPNVIGGTAWFDSLTKQWSDILALQVGFNPVAIESWMPIPAPPEPVEEPIYINVDGVRREVIFEDGSLAVGCTTVPKGTMERIVARWTKENQ